MIAETLVCLLLVLGVTFGLSRPLIGRFRLSGPEAVVAGAALSLIAAWLVAWVVFTSGCPTWGYALLPALALAAIVADRRGIARLLLDPGARELLGGQLIVTGWCVAWLAFIKNYSGGLWTGDWFEHWQRALFFLRKLPPERLFLGVYTLEARPPLANVLTAAFMQLTKVDYLRYQIVMAALSSLAFLPVALLAARFGGRRASRIAVVVMMVNPLFIENATYPWTKLLAAFFVLAGLYFFLRVRDRDEGSGRAATLCALALGGAILTHYSAGPYVVVLAAAWLLLGARRGWERGYLRMTAGAAGAGACVLAPWFLWSLAHSGAQGTFLSNTSVTTLGTLEGSHLVRIVRNLVATLVPPQARGVRSDLYSQTSPWGALRDQAFVIYQLNLPLALGAVGFLATAREAWRAARGASRADVLFWAGALPGFVVLGIVVVSVRDDYGLTHICLQPVVLLGLAFLASRWERLGRGWRAALVAGWTADFVFGIALQFAVEDFAIDRRMLPGRTLGDVSMTYNVVSQLNVKAKVVSNLAYFADLLPVSPALVLGLLAAIFCMALLRARQAQVTPSSR